MYVISRVRLANDTRAITTKTGTRMQTCFGFADIDGESGLPVGIVAFGNLADELAKYRNGSTIRVSGIFKANDYVNKQGEEVNGYQIVADGIMGVKSARGKYSTPKPKADNQVDQQQRNQATQEFYEDEISF